MEDDPALLPHDEKAHKKYLNTLLTNLTMNNVEKIGKKMRNIQFQSKEQLEYLSDLIFHYLKYRPEKVSEYACLCRELRDLKLNVFRFETVNEKDWLEYSNLRFNLILAARIEMAYDQLGHVKEKFQAYAQYLDRSLVIAVVKHVTTQMVFAAELYKNDMLSAEFIFAVISRLSYMIEMSDMCLECMVSVMERTSKQLENRNYSLSGYFKIFKDIVRYNDVDSEILDRIKHLLKLRAIKWIGGEEEVPPEQVVNLIIDDAYTERTLEAVQKELTRFIYLDRCGQCCEDFNPDDRIKHLTSKEHAIKMQILLRDQYDCNIISGREKSCVICQEFNLEKAFDHFKSRTHKLNSTSYCYLCQQKFTAAYFLSMHLITLTHRKEVLRIYDAILNTKLYNEITAKEKNFLDYDPSEDDEPLIDFEKYDELVKDSAGLKNTIFKYLDLLTVESQNEESELQELVIEQMDRLIENFYTLKNISVDSTLDLLRQFHQELDDVKASITGLSKPYVDEGAQGAVVAPSNLIAKLKNQYEKLFEEIDRKMETCKRIQKQFGLRGGEPKPLVQFTENNEQPAGESKSPFLEEKCEDTSLPLIPQEDSQNHTLQTSTEKNKTETDLIENFVKKFEEIYLSQISQEDAQNHNLQSSPEKGNKTETNLSENFVEKCEETFLPRISQEDVQNHNLQNSPEKSNKNKTETDLVQNLIKKWEEIYLSRISQEEAQNYNLQSSPEKGNETETNLNENFVQKCEETFLPRISQEDVQNRNLRNSPEKGNKNKTETNLTENLIEKWEKIYLPRIFPEDAQNHNLQSSPEKGNKTATNLEENFVEKCEETFLPRISQEDAHNHNLQTSPEEGNKSETNLKENLAEKWEILYVPLISQEDAQQQNLQSSPEKGNKTETNLEENVVEKGEETYLPRISQEDAHNYNLQTSPGKGNKSETNLKENLAEKWEILYVPLISQEEQQQQNLQSSPEKENKNQTETNFKENFAVKWEATHLPRISQETETNLKENLAKKWNIIYFPRISHEEAQTQNLQSSPEKVKNNTETNLKENLAKEREEIYLPKISQEDAQKQNLQLSSEKANKNNTETNLMENLPIKCKIIYLPRISPEYAQIYNLPSSPEKGNKDNTETNLKETLEEKCEETSLHQKSQEEEDAQNHILQSSPKKDYKNKTGTNLLAESEKEEFTTEIYIENIIDISNETNIRKATQTEDVVSTNRTSNEFLNVSQENKNLYKTSSSLDTDPTKSQYCEKEKDIGVIPSISQETLTNVVELSAEINLAEESNQENKTTCEFHKSVGKETFQQSQATQNEPSIISEHKTENSTTKSSVAIPKTKNVHEEKCESGNLPQKSNKTRPILLQITDFISKSSGQKIKYACDTDLRKINPINRIVTITSPTSENSNNIAKIDPSDIVPIFIQKNSAYVKREEVRPSTSRTIDSTPPITSNLKKVKIRTFERLKIKIPQRLRSHETKNAKQIIKEEKLIKDVINIIKKGFWSDDFSLTFMFRLFSNFNEELASTIKRISTD